MSLINISRLLLRCSDASFCPPSQNGWAVFVPHPYECNKYFACQPGFGAIGPMLCPGNLQFDPELNICNYNWAVGCVNTPYPTQPTTTTTPATTTPVTTTTPATTMESNRGPTDLGPKRETITFGTKEKAWQGKFLMGLLTSS